MRYGHVPDVSKPVSRLVMGSMVFSTERLENTFALLDRFVAAGGNAVDTARVYAKGTSEEAFGQWLQARGNRDEIVVIGKGAHHDNQTLERRINAEAIHQDIQTSLEKMQLDSMDIYILHKDDPEAPVGPVVEALNEEAATGRIGAFGGSSWTHQRLDEANAYARAHGLKPFGVSSPNLALAIPNEPMWIGCVTIAGDPEGQEWYARTQMPLFAWSSQARGFFSGRYAADSEDGDPLVIKTYFSDDNWERYRRAGEIAKKKGCTLQQAVLAWVLHQPQNVFALIGPATVAELEDCLGALDVSLTPEELGWMNLEKAAVRVAAT
jgi:aryl-alcohol dehydrogenase-like predicted oxidoreductase